MIKNAKCIIDLAAVRHNLQTIKKLAAGRKIILMVKSNAYGHGLLEVCQQLDNDVALGLIEFDKALLLRQHNFQQKIILMTGPSDITDIETAAKNNFDLVIHQQYQIDLLRQAKVENKINIWLKVNTGMNRLGFFISDAADAFKQITALDITANTNVISHLSSPDEPTSTACQSQLKKLQQLHELIPEAEFSFCNSAGLINNLYPEANWLRPGIILYGISPVKDKTAADLNLKPVMTVQAPIISIYRVTAGDTIGYGATYLCKKDMTIACVKIGYGDGYLRCTKSGTSVMYKGQQCQVVGRVSMNMITIDISNINNTEINDMVTIWGNELPIENVATGANTIAYELTTRLNPDISREYRN